MILDGEQRRLLRREVDRQIRLKLGECPPTGGWITLTEASGIVGIKSSNLARKLIALGVETKKKANRRLIPVEALDLFREWD